MFHVSCFMFLSFELRIPAYRQAGLHTHQNLNLKRNPLGWHDRLDFQFIPRPRR